MSKTPSEIDEAYQRYHIDARTAQILALLQTAAIADDQLISTKQLAALFGVSEQWVEITRHRGEGPKWVKISERCIRYRMAAVIAWLQERGEARAKYEAQKHRGDAQPNRQRRRKA
jgi:predicted DNA-binding transcriptional regulator AlpA